jgi:hypothetical protein
MKTITDKTRSRYSKQHYEDIARLFKGQRPALRDDGGGYASDRFRQWTAMVLAAATLFENDNPRFKRRQFLKACNYPENL